MNSRALLPIALTALVALQGCTSFEMARLRNQIDRDMPEAEIGDGFALAFGAITMGTARTALAIGDDGSDPSTRAVRALLRNVKKVQIGRYAVDGSVRPDAISTPRVFDAYARDGWLPVITVRGEEAVWILARDKRERLRDLLVVVLSDEELVLAKASGNLEAGVVAALRETSLTRDLARSLTAPPDSLAASDTTASG